MKYEKPTPEMQEGTLGVDVFLDTSKIPEYVTDRLAVATLDFIRRLKSNPETCAQLEAYKRELFPTEGDI